MENSNVESVTISLSRYNKLMESANIVKTNSYAIGGYNKVTYYSKQEFSSKVYEEQNRIINFLEEEKRRLTEEIDILVSEKKCWLCSK